MDYLDYTEIIFAQKEVSLVTVQMTAILSPHYLWFFRNLVEAQVAEDHFPFEQVKRCSPKHYSLYSF